MRFKPITGAEYDQWVSEGGRTRYIVTALAPELTAAHLQAVTKIVSSQGFNIETVTRLSVVSTLKRIAHSHVVPVYSLV